jgi:hypothetical protein
MIIYCQLTCDHIDVTKTITVIILFNDYITCNIINITKTITVIILSNDKIDCDHIKCMLPCKHQSKIK